MNGVYQAALRTMFPQFGQSGNTGVVPPGFNHPGSFGPMQTGGALPSQPMQGMQTGGNAPAYPMQPPMMGGALPPQGMPQMHTGGYDAPQQMPGMRMGGPMQPQGGYDSSGINPHGMYTGGPMRPMGGREFGPRGFNLFGQRPAGHLGGRP